MSDEPLYCTICGAEDCEHCPDPGEGSFCEECSVNRTLNNSCPCDTRKKNTKEDTV